MKTNVEQHNVKALWSVYFTQFLSAFADNLNFFIIVGYLMRKGVTHTDTYVTNIQIGFLLAYVVLAPVVGAFADKHAKSRVLLTGNFFKSAGILLLILGLDPIVCYTILGVGAVIYSPAKYGILSELTHSEKGLLRANATVEGSTILAILLGTVAGGYLADISDMAGLMTCLLLYVTSLAFTFLIPKMAGSREIRYGHSARMFIKDVKTLFGNRKARFSLIGTASFWLTAAVLRIALVAWIPANLGIEDTTKQSMIIGVTAIGVIISSFIIPRIIRSGRLHRSYVNGFFMVGLVMVAAFQHNVWVTVVFLLFIGLFGGIYLIPLNTLLQEEGKQLIGTGKTIAIQNFVENSLTVSGLAVYSVMRMLDVPVQWSVVWIGCILLLFVLYLFSQAAKVGSGGNEAGDDPRIAK